MNTFRVESTTLRVTRFFEVLEKGFVVLALLLYAGVVLHVLRLHETGGIINDPLAGDPLSRNIYSAIYVVTLFLLLLRWRRLIYVATRDKLLLLLIGVAVVSVFWSFEPDITLRRSVGLLGTTLFGIYLATRFSLREQLRLLALALGLAVLINLLFAVALPSYSVFADPIRGNALQGAFSHKNVLGRSMVLAAVVFLLFFLEDRRYRWVTGFGIGLSVGLLLLSRSATALIAFLILLLLFPLYRALRGRYASLVPFLIGGVVLFGGLTIWLLGSEQNALGALGRDVTLTGRTDIWTTALYEIWQHPWLGYGYGGFWVGWKGPSAQVGLALLNPRYGVLAQMPPHAHNGFLDLWLDLGLLGLSVFALGLLSAVARALAWIRPGKKAAENFWPLVYLSFVLLFSMTESTMLGVNSIFWILYVSILLSTFATPAKLLQGSSSARPTNVKAATLR